MAKEIIGHVDCPYCGYEKAEVKETSKVYQSKAFVMVWCPHPACQSQYFPRSKEGSDRVRAKMRYIQHEQQDKQEDLPEPPRYRTFADFVDGR